MTKSKILVLAAAPALLCGCATKCSFVDFQKKVAEIAEKDEENLEKCAIRGTVKVGGEEIKVDRVFDENSSKDGLSIVDTFVMGLMIGNHVADYALVEDKEATYYAGSTFKIEFKVITYEFDKFGFCTKAKGDSKDGLITYTVDLNASYTWKA